MTTLTPLTPLDIHWTCATGTHEVRAGADVLARYPVEDVGMPEPPDVWPGVEAALRKLGHFKPEEG